VKGNFLNKLLALLLLLSIGETVLAQIRVVVLVAGQKEPIAHVSIISKTGVGTDFQFTNDRGVAFVDTSGLKSPLITFSHIDYQDRVLDLSQIRKANFHIFMKSAYSQLPDFVHFQKRPERANEIVVSSRTIDKKKFKMQVPQTAADVLESSESVFVQKSQMGGGSPMIRGFSANRLLLIVDGIRINNAIFRDGNVHNVISIDAQMLESVEVYEGPGSVIFGSDAMGGVMYFNTTKLETIKSKTPNFSGNTGLQFHSANRGNTWHIDFKSQAQNWAAVTGVTLSNYGSLRMGSKGENQFLSKYYVEHINGKDTMVQNDNDLVQEFSGYTQVNVSQKFLYQKDSNFDIRAALFFATTSPIPRYDRLSQFEGDTLKYAEWNYGPQRWLMSYAVANWRKKKLLYDRLGLTGSVQQVQESRLTRNFDDTIRTKRTEDLFIYSINIDADKKTGSKTTLFYGMEWLSNLLHSESEELNIIDFSSNEGLTTRYPDGSTWSAAAAYFTGKHTLDSHWVLKAGFRANSIRYIAPFRQGLATSFEHIDRVFQGFNGSLGLNYHPDSRTILTMNLASGFRAPNIDDIGKIFDSQPGKITVPNSALESETVYSIDLSYVRKPNHRSKFGGNVFYSIWDGPIQRSNFQIDGEDSLIFEGELLEIQALVNGNQAFLYGAGIFGDYRFTNAFKTELSLNWQTGQTSDNEPIRHIAPAFGALHFIYIANKIKLDLYTRFNGAINADQMAPSERGKVHIYALNEDGQTYSPSWYTINVKAIYTVSSKLNMSFGIENIEDKHYRPYSSGISAPGLNAIFSLRSRF
jgi:hemoglobin/transferrin/lactoferrin receptor protein